MHKTCAIIAVLGLSGAAAAQSSLIQVDAGHSDVSRGALSLKRFDVDLRKPSGFDRVYLKRGVNGEPDTFVRIDGATTAVFPTSVYSDGTAGTFADIPPGTIFLIGALPEAPRPPAPRSLNYIDTRVVDGPAAVPGPPVISRPSQFLDDQYRGQRLETLLMRALKSENL